MAENVRLYIPSAGRKIAQTVEAGDRIVFNFPIDSTDMELSRAGDDLSISFANNSSVTVRDFFTFSDLTVLAGDTELSSNDFLSAVAPDLATAADAVSGGGAHNYSDDAGNLVNSLDRLGAADGTGSSSSIGARGVMDAGTGDASAQGRLSAKVSLSVNANIVGDDGKFIEGSTITITARVDNPPSQDLYIHLDNGETIVIKAGETEGSVSFPARPDDVYKQGDEGYSVGVSGVDGGGGYAGIDTGGGVTYTVSDDQDVSKVEIKVVDAQGNEITGPVPEGTDVFVVAEVDNPPQGDLVLTVKDQNGNEYQVIIKDGQTSSDPVQVYVRPDDEYKDPDEEFLLTIEDAKGGNYEALDTTDTADYTVTDQGSAGGGSGGGGGGGGQGGGDDGVTISLSVNGDRFVEGEEVTITAVISSPPREDLVIHLDNGQTITIRAGETTGSVNYESRPDDVYVQGDESITVKIDHVDGADQYENLVVNGPGSSAGYTVVDDQDATTVSLKLVDAQGNEITGPIPEGADVRVVAEVTNPPQGDLVLTVTGSDGREYTVIIRDGQLSSEPVPVYVRPDDNLSQRDDHVSLSVSDAQGGNYEDLDIGDTAEYAVTDQGSGGGDDQAPVLTLHVAGTDANGALIEGGQLGVYATVTPPSDKDLSVTIADGRGGSYTVTIPAGQNNSNVANVPVRPDDVYKEADDIYNFTVNDTQGGNYEQGLIVNDGQGAVVMDDQDASKVTLVLVDAQGNEIRGPVPEGTDVRVVARVDNPPQGDLVLKVTGSDGHEYTVIIRDGHTASEPVPVYVRPDDSLSQRDDQVSLSVTDASGAGADNYEALDLSNSGKDYTVTDQGSGGGDDQAPTLTVHVSGTDANGNIVEGGQLGVYVTVTPPSDTDLSVTLSDGRGGSYTVTIPAGQNSSNVANVPVRPDDVYKEADDVYNFTVDNAQGGNYEQNLVINDGKGATVIDDQDATSVSLKLVDAQGNEITGPIPEGADVRVVAEVTNPPQGDLVLTVTGSDGREYTVIIRDGQLSSEPVPVYVRPDDNLSQRDDHVSLSVSDAQGGNYEDLDIGDTAEYAVTDQGSGGGDDQAPVLTLHVAGTDANGALIEGGQLGVYATVTPPSDKDLSVTIADGRGGSYTVTIPAGQNSSNVANVPVRPDDVYKEADDIYNFTVNNTQGGNYEQGLTVNDGQGAVVMDDQDASKVTLVLVDAQGNEIRGPVPEGTDVRVVARVDNPPQGDLVLKVTGSDGHEYTVIIRDGHTASEPVPVYVRPDDSLSQRDDQVSLSVTDASGAGADNYEALDLSNSGKDYTVTDQGSGGGDDQAPTLTVHVSGTDANGNIVEGGQLGVYVTVTPPSDTDLSVTLSDGRGGSYTVTIPAGQNSSNVANVPVRPDDVYKEADDVYNFTVNNTQGGNYEQNLTVNDGKGATVIDDMDATSVSLRLVDAQGNTITGPIPEGANVSVVATVSNPPQGDLTLTVTGSDGRQYTVIIRDGQLSSAPVPVYVRPDDNLSQKNDQIDLSVTDARGGNYEDLHTGGGAHYTVTDQGSGGGDDQAPTLTVHVTGTNSDGNMVEGGQLGVYVTVNPPSDRPLTVNLSDGRGGSYTVTIPAGQNSSNVANVPVRPDDVYKEADDIYNFTVNNTQGGNYEQNLVINDGQGATVIDDMDATSVRLKLVDAQGNEINGPVPEGSDVRMVAEVPNPPKGDLVLTVTGSDGRQYTVIIRDGQYASEPVPVQVRPDDAVAQRDEHISLSVTDASGPGADNYEALDTGNAGREYTVTDQGSQTPDHGVSINAGSDTVYESGLAHGTAEGHTNLTANGSFQVSEGASNVHVSLGGQDTGLNLPGAPGQSVSLTFPNGHPCAGDTFTVTNNGDGNYSYEYTLGGAKQHGAPGSATDQNLDVKLEVSATGPDGKSYSSSTEIHVQDDTLSAMDPDKIVLTETPPSNYYVSFGLDMSNSMNSSAGIAGDPRTRFQVMKDSMLDLLHEYQQVHGDVKVNIVLFGSSSQTVGAGMTVSQALSYISGLAAPNSSGSYGYGSTNYAACLNAMQNMVNTGLTDAQYDGYTNQVFFISDGAPNAGSSNGSYVPGAWKDLVTGPHADDLNVYSVGIGSSSSSMENNLKQVCNASELGQPGGDQYVHVSNMNSLSNILTDMANIQTGNMAAQNVLGADGVSQIFSYVDGNGVEHVIDWSDAGQIVQGYYRIVLADDGQGNSTWLDIKENGDYILRVNGEVRPDHYDNIKITLVDGDGDKLSLDGDITILPHDPGQSGISQSSLILGTGGSVIFGTSGDETLVGNNQGDDIFAWNKSDLGGVDDILDFNMEGDKVFFEGLFSGDGGVNISELLADQTLSLSMNDASSLELIYNKDGVSQTVNIQLTEADHDAFDSINSSDTAAADAAKAVLLQQILLNTM